MADGTLRVKNLARFQHYTDRNPPWVKLHSDVFTNYDFGQLPDETKWHALALVLLASKTGNEIPNDPEWIRDRTQSRKPPNVELLLKIGFLEHGASKVLAPSASESLATRKQNGGTEKRREEESGGASIPLAAAPNGNGACPEKWVVLRDRLLGSVVLRDRTDLFDWSWWDQQNEIVKASGVEVNLMEQLARIEEWAMRKPSRFSKTRSTKRFVNNWLKEAVERAR